MKKFQLCFIPLMYLVSVNLALCQVRVVGSNAYYPVRIGAAPGEVVTFYVTGLQLRLDAPLMADGPQLPETLGGISVTIRDHRELKDHAAPILSIKPYSSCRALDKTNDACLVYGIAAQIPWELRSDGLAGIVRATGLGGYQFPETSGSDTERYSVVISEDGVESAEFRFSVLFNNLRVLNICNEVFRSSALNALSALPVPLSGCGNAIRGADGLFGGRPRVGETVRIYLTGLPFNLLDLRNGEPTPSEGATLAKAVVVVGGGVGLNLLGSVPGFAFESLSTPYPVNQNSLADLFMAPGMYGVYYMEYKVSATLPSLAYRCQGSNASNVTLRISTIPSSQASVGALSFDNIRFCVEP